MYLRSKEENGGRRGIILKGEQLERNGYYMVALQKQRGLVHKAYSKPLRGAVHFSSTLVTVPPLTAVVVMAIDRS